MDGTIRDQPNSTSTATAADAVAVRASARADWSGARRDFGLLWTGQSVSLLADQVMVVVLPLFAVVVLHASPAQAALLPFALYAPSAVLGLPAGAIIDRLPRRPVMMACDGVRALAFATMAALAWWHSLSFPLLMALVGVSGCATVFFQIAYTSYLPTLVTGRDALHRGNARLSFSESVSRAAGPLLAGPLVTLVGPVVAVATNAGSFVFSLATLCGIRRERAPVRVTAQRPRLRAEIREGLAFVFAHPLLQPVILCGTAYVLALSLIDASLVLFCHEVLKLGPALIGVVIGIAALGYPIGNMLSATLIARFGMARTLVLAATVSVAGLATMPIFGALGSLPGLVTASIVHGTGEGAFTPTSLTLRHTVTPAGLLGRVNSVQRVLLTGAIPIGSLLASAIVAASGLTAALWVGGVGTTLCLVPLLRRGVLASMRGPRPSASADLGVETCERLTTVPVG